MEKMSYGERPVPARKIYTYKALWVGTIIGGPLVAGYFIAENFKTFNKPRKAKITWAWTIAATILIFGVSFFVPADLKSPKFLIPPIYTGVAYGLMRHFQKWSIAVHIVSGGESYSWWRVIAVCLIGLAISFVILFAFAALLIDIKLIQ